MDLSVSTVGRILAKGVRLGRVRSCAFYQGKLQRNGVAISKKVKRWRYGMKAAQPGQLVQIDPMNVSPLPGVRFKEFKAICPISKQMVVRCYSRATARNATRFLQAVLKEMPFPVTSLQVDGGSEFMAEFETACQNLDLPLQSPPVQRLCSPDHTLGVLDLLRRGVEGGRHQRLPSPSFPGPLAVNLSHRGTRTFF